MKHFPGLLFTIVLLTGGGKAQITTIPGGGVGVIGTISSGTPGQFPYYTGPTTLGPASGAAYNATTSHSALGPSATPDLFDPSIVTMFETMTNLDNGLNGSVNGLYLALSLNPSGFANDVAYGTQQYVTTNAANAANYGVVIGNFVQASHVGSGTFQQLLGVETNAYHYGSNTCTESIAGLLTSGNFGTGVISLAAGLRAGVINDVGGTVVNGYGVQIVGGANNGMGTFTNNVGMKVEDQTGGASNWAIKTGLGKVEFGHLVVSTGAAPAVTGCTSATIVAGSTYLAGQVNGTPTGTCAVTLTFDTAAPHGYNCAISNQTTANLIRQTASTPTTAVLTGTTVANDVLAYGPCVGW